MEITRLGAPNCLGGGGVLGFVDLALGVGGLHIIIGISFSIIIIREYY